MKFRALIAIAGALSIGVIGCTDDITNIIEEVPATEVPDTPGTPTEAPDTPTEAPVTPTMGVPVCEDAEEGEEVVCGDGICHNPEQCDIGGICVGGDNDLDACTSPDDCPGGRCTVVGGQPSGDGSCSANCTLEDRRTAPYAEGTGSLVQTANFGIPVVLTGQQTIQTGQPRPDDTVDINGEVTFRAGDIPMITKAEDIQIDPASVPGLVCACVRGIEVPAFGAGNSATGLISCGGELDDIDYVVTQDHHTDPLDDFETNEECALDPDPECDDSREIVPGVVSNACREQEDPDCSDPAVNRHAGVCNSPRSFEFSGTGPAGSGIIFNNTAIGLLSDMGQCNLGFGGMDPCPFEDYGPDCLPCTDDDLDFGIPENNPTTTGSARARVVNATNLEGRVIDEGSLTSCEDNDGCSQLLCGNEEVCRPIMSGPDAPTVCGLACGGTVCRTVAEGTPFDCDAIANNPSGGLGGGAFAVSFPSIDAAIIGDNVTTVIFAFDE